MPAQNGSNQICCYLIFFAVCQLAIFHPLWFHKYLMVDFEAVERLVGAGASAAETE
jgi:hypothetical protein